MRMTITTIAVAILFTACTPPPPPYETDDVGPDPCSAEDLRSVHPTCPNVSTSPADQVVVK